MHLVMLYQMYPGESVLLIPRRIYLRWCRRFIWLTLPPMFHTIFRLPDAQPVWARAGEVVGFWRENFRLLLDTWKNFSMSCCHLRTRRKQYGRKYGQITPTELLHREIRLGADATGISVTLTW